MTRNGSVETWNAEIRETGLPQCNSFFFCRKSAKLSSKGTPTTTTWAAVLDQQQFPATRVAMATQQMCPTTTWSVMATHQLFPVTWAARPAIQYVMILVCTRCQHNSPTPQRRRRLQEAVGEFGFSYSHREMISIEEKTRNHTNGSNVFCFPSSLHPPPPSHHGSGWLLPVISLLLTNTVSPVRACLSIWWERLRGT